MPRISKKKLWEPRNPIRPVRRSPLEFDRMGKEIEDAPLIRRKYSFWAIDDSGTPDFAPKSSDYLTLSAISTLERTDYDALFENITRRDGEIKFSVLSLEHEDECLTVMRRLGRTTAVLLCYPRYKDPENPRDAGEFFLESIRRLIDGIMKIDRSELIIIAIDENPYLDTTDYYELCSTRCIVHPVDSKDSKLAQTADLAASSLGHGLLPANKGDTKYFEEIKAKGVNVHGKPGVSTQQTPKGFNRDIIESDTEDKSIVKDSKNVTRKSDGKARDSKGRFVSTDKSKSRRSSR